MRLTLLVAILAMALVRPAWAQEMEPELLEVVPTETDLMAGALRASVVAWEVARPAGVSASSTQRELQVTMEWANTGADPIRAWSGVFHVLDLFGRELKVADLTVQNLALAPGQVVRHRYSLRLSTIGASDTVLRNAPGDGLVFVFEHRAVLFDDGRLLGSPAGLR